MYIHWVLRLALWGQYDGWPIIPGQMRWIEESHQVRVDVAHGLKSIDIYIVAEVAQRLPVIEQVCFRFLTDWRERFLGMDRQPPSETRPAFSQELSHE
jgi:hypothetical protein